VTHPVSDTTPTRRCNLALELTISAAAVARGWTSYVATLFHAPPNALRVQMGVISLVRMFALTLVHTLFIPYKLNPDYPYLESTWFQAMNP
jgi:hypothetical protein